MTPRLSAPHVRVPRPPGDQRRGATLVELCAGLLVLAIVAGAGARATAAVADGAAVRAAGAELRAAFALARAVGVRRGERAALRLDSATASVAVHLGADTLRRVSLGRTYGVRLTATRDSMAYTALGLGHGAANLRAVLARGTARDTVTVSRLGRVR